MCTVSSICTLDLVQTTMTLRRQKKNLGSRSGRCSQEQAVTEVFMHMAHSVSAVSQNKL